jgi:hypothetical protein
MNAHDDNTFFASPERSRGDELHVELCEVASNEVLKGILRNTSGMLAILNEHRQILAINDTLLKMLGIEDPERVLGLRPGEAINCIHANDMPAGCGTSKFCASCGAAIAIVSSIDSDKPQERTCLAQVKRDGKIADLYLRVTASPIEYRGQRFIMLFLQDISIMQKRALLERVFFHDISNIAMALLSGAEMLNVCKLDQRCEETAQDILEAANMLAHEIKLQKILIGDEPIEMGLNMREVSTREIVEDILRMFRNHPAAKGKVILAEDISEDRHFYTDKSLGLRVLNNMMLNALEASDDGDEIRIAVENSPKDIFFKIWNRKSIPEPIALRMFQRNFSTKADTGRGLGTYSMKLFAEHYLDGEITFTTAPEIGTTFTLKLPA